MEKEQWKVNTAKFFDRILEIDPTMNGAIKKPLEIFRGLLVEVGNRATELNDPILNALMCRLTIYSVADQYDADFNKDIVNDVYKKADEYNQSKDNVNIEKDLKIKNKITDVIDAWKSSLDRDKEVICGTNGFGTGDGAYKFYNSASEELINNLVEVVKDVEEEED
jgi:hypothetical protein